MRYLAKAGFTQSYTYFTWRNTKAELTEYFTELTTTEVARVPAAESLREHAGHPPRLPAARRPAGVRGAAAAGGDARRELRHLQRLRARARAQALGPAPRSTPTRKSTSSATGTGTGPATSRELVCRVNAIRHAAPRAAVRRHAAVPRDRQPRDHRLQQDARPTAPIALLTIVNLDPHHMQHGHVDVPASARRCRSPSAISWTMRATRGTAAGTTCASIPDIRQGHILWLPTTAEL